MRNLHLNCIYTLGGNILSCSPGHRPNFKPSAGQASQQGKCNSVDQQQQAGWQPYVQKVSVPNSVKPIKSCMCAFTLLEDGVAGLANLNTGVNSNICSAWIKDKRKKRHYMHCIMYSMSVIIQCCEKSNIGRTDGCATVDYTKPANKPRLVSDMEKDGFELHSAGQTQCSF